MKKWLFAFLFFYACTCHAQDTTSAGYEAVAKPVNFRQRQWLIGALTTAGYGGSFVFLSTAWYKEYPRRSLHSFNDAKEWQQVDKAGHAWTAYHTSRFTTNMWRWAGVEDKRALLYGTGSSMLYMLSIEYLDGRSSQWGWSWADVGANFFGAGLYAGQELAWKEQKVGFKFSAHHKNYSESDLEKRADDLFGSSFQGRLLKDYNAQTYWLSGNIKSFFPNTSLPAWLSISVGYGAEGMFGGFENRAIDKEDGNITFDRRDIKRYRQWYLAPDIDLTKIKTNSKVLRSVFSALNVLKFPAPALEYSQGRFHFRAIAY